MEYRNAVMRAWGSSEQRVQLAQVGETLEGFKGMASQVVSTTPAACRRSGPAHTPVPTLGLIMLIGPGAHRDNANPNQAGGEKGAWINPLRWSPHMQLHSERDKDTPPPLVAPRHPPPTTDPLL